MIFTHADIIAWTINDDLSVYDSKLRIEILERFRRLQDINRIFGTMGKEEKEILTKHNEK